MGTSRTKRGRKAVPLELKKSIALRLQRAIDFQFGTFEGLHKWAVASSREALANTAHNWLPPQTRWRAEPKGGTKVRPVDWQQCATPDIPSLVAFCEATGVSADFLLLGRGPTPYAGATRETQTLEEDLDVAVSNAVMQRARRGDYDEVLDGIALRTLSKSWFSSEFTEAIMLATRGRRLSDSIDAADKLVREQLP